MVSEPVTNFWINGGASESKGNICFSLWQQLENCEDGSALITNLFKLQWFARIAGIAETSQWYLSPVKCWAESATVYPELTDNRYLRTPPFLLFLCLSYVLRPFKIWSPVHFFFICTWLYMPHLKMCLMAPFRMLFTSLLGLFLISHPPLLSLFNTFSCSVHLLFFVLLRRGFLARCLAHGMLHQCLWAGSKRWWTLLLSLRRPFFHLYIFWQRRQ